MKASSEMINCKEREQKFPPVTWKTGSNQRISLMLPLKIITWNMKGFEKSKENTSIKAIIYKYCPDIVLIQETKKETIDRKCLASFWGSLDHNWTAIPSIRAAGGLLIAWNTDFFELVQLNMVFSPCL